MKYIKKTCEYLFVLGKGARFGLMLLVSLAFGFALAILAPNSRYLSWGANYEVGNMNFIEQWNFGNVSAYWYAMIAVFVLGVIVISILATVVSRSMRVGTFRLKRPTAEFNENCFSGFFVVVCFIVTMLISKALLTLFLVLASAISSFAFSLGVAIFSLLVVNAIFFLIIALQLVVLPTMAINGVMLKSAALSSIRKCGARLGGIFVALIIPYLMLIGVGVGIACLQISWLNIFVDTLLYASFITYFVALSMVIYYKIEQIKREDYPKYHFKNSDNWN